MISEKASARSAKQSFRDLQVWQRAMQLTTGVYQLTRTFPREETFGLISQLRRSAVSIPSDVAEGHGRMSPREFKHFLLIACGSNSELQTQLQLSADLGFGDPKEIGRARGLWEEVENMLFALLGRLRSSG